MKNLVFNFRSNPILWVITICLVAMWIRIGWVWIYPYKPIIIHSDKLLILNENKRVCRGGNIIVQGDIEKTMALETEVHTELINYYSDTLSPFVADRECGRKKIAKKIRIKKYAELGKYKVFRTFKTHVSDFPDRDVKVSVWSEEFEVVECNHPKGYHDIED